MRASGRSILLTTRITCSCSSSALRSTKRVWGSGPSLASTSSSTPSTIVRPRSTSPPKSACPGVSMMLIFVPPWRTAVFLARIVMPFSRSRSPESRTRSCTDSFSRKAPDCHSIASTSVVLPWSTCAMIATLRMSARSATPAVSATCPLRAAGDGRKSVGNQQKTAIVKLVETAVPLARFVCTRTEVWLGKPGARSTPVLLWETNAAPWMPVVERPAPA